MWGFAWVDKSDDAFLPTFVREDEDVFALSIQHAEGDFPMAQVDIRNPRVGLLGPARKQWVWISRDGVGVFFGRVLGVPQALQDAVIRVTFIARPADYDAQRAALAASMRVAPWYVDVWLNEQERADPDSVLEGRSALWHIDRTSHVVTASDIITGEDGVELFSGADAFYDSVKLTHGQSPLRRVDVKAGVRWSQAGAGGFDVTRRLLGAFAAATPAELTNIDNTSAPSEGMVCIAGGDQLIARWPREGQSIGSGWEVGVSFANVIGGAPLPPLGVGDNQELGVIRNELAQGGSVSVGTSSKYQFYFDLFKRSPGFLTAVLTRPAAATTSFGIATGSYDVYWVPVWRIAPHLEVRWSTERARTESVTFSVSADVQPLLSDPDDEEIGQLTVGPVDVDVAIEDRRRNRWFNTDDGKASFENLLARARALLLARSRAVRVEFETTIERGLDLSCRKSATIVDPRLPGGQATGKIVAYTISMDGNTGQGVASVTIGCCVGRGGEVEVVEGEPDYVELGYVNPGYQTTHDGVTVPLAGDLGYSGLDGYAIDDDGVNLFNVGPGMIHTLSVTGGLVDQEGARVEIGDSLLPVSPFGPSRFQQFTNIAKALDSVNAIETTVTLSLHPVTGGPFDTEIVPIVTELKVPRTIDLEDAT